MSIPTFQRKTLEFTGFCVSIIAKECTGDAIGFDLRRTNKSDGVIIYWDHETGKISREWNNLAEWLDYEMEMGKGLINYDGSESDF